MDRSKLSRAAGEPEAGSPAAAPDTACPFEDGELEQLSNRMREELGRMFRLRPNHEISSSVRGLPAVMHALVDSGRALSPGELSRACDLTDARIANILKVLEERGYIERRGSSKDRRRVEVTATERGIEHHNERFRAYDRMMSKFLIRLGERDAREFVRILGRANDIVERDVWAAVSETSPSSGIGRARKGVANGRADAPPEPQDRFDVPLRCEDEPCEKGADA